MQLQNVHPVIGDVRGKGLMLAIELVEPGTKQALSVNDVSDIMDTIRDLGVLIGRGGRWSNVSFFICRVLFLVPTQIYVTIVSI